MESARLALIVAELTKPDGAGPSGFGTWTQLGQAIVTFANLCLVVYFFFRSRRDKEREQRLSVASFWLQKVIVEPHTKAVDDLHAALEDHLLKAQAAARSIHAEDLGRRDEAIGSYADVASRRLEKFLSQLLPLLIVVVDEGSTVAEKPSSKVQNLVDQIDHAVTVAIARVFDDPASNIEGALETLRKCRFDLLHVLFLLHKHPFESPTWRG